MEQSKVKCEFGQDGRDCRSKGEGNKYQISIIRPENQ